jgi:ribosomal protein S18 acetylase RimI-like enzyme
MGLRRTVLPVRMASAARSREDPSVRAARPSRRRPRADAAEVRLATRADLPTLARLGAKLAREHHAMDPERFFLPDEPIEDGYAWWLGKELANPRAVVLAARSGNGVIGYAYGRIEPRDWNTLRDRCGVGVDLWVEPRARGAGIGAKLVQALADALAERGAARVVIDVAARNPEAARLFERIGFRPTMLEMTIEASGVRRGTSRRAAPSDRRG